LLRRACPRFSETCYPPAAALARIVFPGFGRSWSADGGSIGILGYHGNLLIVEIVFRQKEAILSGSGSL
jgi:hypothetical protein